MPPYTLLKKAVSIAIVMAFISTSVQSPLMAQEVFSSDPMPFMPTPGSMVQLSPAYTPAYLKGIVIHPENALKFDFIIYKGDKELAMSDKRDEYTKLTKYFLASLAIPDEDQWVNLSPYEKDRIIQDDFGKTEMGRDLLAQDYMLKQITASLIYPDDSLGKKFWEKVYAKAQQQFGTTNIPVNTFNKVWILPDDAVIYEKGNTAYVLRNHLRVMLEEDYLSLQHHVAISSAPASSASPDSVNTLGSQIVRDIVLPELQREVNEDENFSAVRQVYSGMLLATWYKHALKESLLSKIYADQSKVKGVDQDPRTNEEIYRQYLKAYKKGVFNFIKEDVDKYTNEVIPRKYFSGGAVDYAQAAADLGKRTVIQTVTALNTNQVEAVQGEESRIDLAQIVAEEQPVAEAALQAIAANQHEQAASSADHAMHAVIANENADLLRSLLDINVLTANAYQSLGSIIIVNALIDRNGIIEKEFLRDKPTKSDEINGKAAIRIIVKLEQGKPVLIKSISYFSDSNGSEDVLQATADVLNSPSRAFVNKDVQLKGRQEGPLSIDYSSPIRLNLANKYSFWIAQLRDLRARDREKILQANSALTADSYVIVNGDGSFIELPEGKNNAVKLGRGDLAHGFAELSDSEISVGHITILRSGNQITLIDGVLGINGNSSTNGTVVTYAEKVPGVNGANVQFAGLPELLQNTLEISIDDYPQFERLLKLRFNGEALPAAKEKLDGLLEELKGQADDYRVKGTNATLGKLKGRDNIVKVMNIVEWRVKFGVETEESPFFKREAPTIVVNEAADEKEQFIEAFRALKTSGMTADEWSVVYGNFSLNRDVEAAVPAGQSEDKTTAVKRVLNIISTRFSANQADKEAKLVGLIQKGLDKAMVADDVLRQMDQAMAAPTMIEFAQTYSQSPHFIYRSAVKRYAQNLVKKLSALSVNTNTSAYLVDPRDVIRVFEPVAITIGLESLDIRAKIEQQMRASNIPDNEGLVNVVQDLIKAYLNPVDENNVAASYEENERSLTRMAFVDIAKAYLNAFPPEVMTPAQVANEQHLARDSAMRVSVPEQGMKKDPLGGIDFNSANLNLQIKRDGKGVPLPIDQQDLQNIHIDGLVPVIIDIKPATSLPLFAELQNSAQAANG